MELLIQHVQLGIGLVKDLVDLHVESVVLLSHRLHRVLLIDAASH